MNDNAGDFVSIGAAARTLGVSAPALRRRIQREADLAIERATQSSSIRGRDNGRREAPQCCHASRPAEVWASVGRFRVATDGKRHPPASVSAIDIAAICLGLRGEVCRIQREGLVLWGDPGDLRRRMIRRGDLEAIAAPRPLTLRGRDVPVPAA